MAVEEVPWGDGKRTLTKAYNLIGLLSLLPNRANNISRRLQIAPGIAPTIPIPGVRSVQLKSNLLVVSERHHRIGFGRSPSRD